MESAIIAGRLMAPGEQYDVGDITMRIRIDALLPLLDPMIGEGMVTVERVHIVSYRSSNAAQP